MGPVPLYGGIPGYVNGGSDGDGCGGSAAWATAASPATAKVAIVKAMVFCNNSILTKGSTPQAAGNNRATGTEISSASEPQEKEIAVLMSRRAPITRFASAPVTGDCFGGQDNRY